MQHLILKDNILLNLRVKLYGILSLSFENYDPAIGLGTEIPHGSSINDLLGHLNISKSRVGMVLIDERSVKKGEKLYEGATVRIFQPIAGG